MYGLSEGEKQRLVQAVSAAYALPFIDDIEDFIWEALFAYVRGIDLVDPLTHIRKKLLFDLVDEKQSIGWSAKALQWSFYPGCEFELVIQRADIFKKASQLGFESLDMSTPTETLGEALLRHWHLKVDNDAREQGVRDMRVCILLKTRDRRKYALYEDDLALYKPEELSWRWTDSSQTGLRGIRKADNLCVYRWYSNQKQFFERFVLYEEAFQFSLTPKRLPLQDVIDLLTGKLSGGSL